MTDEAQSRKQFGWLIPAALIFVGVVFGSFYVKIPIALVWRTLEMLPLNPWLLRALQRSLTAI